MRHTRRWSIVLASLSAGLLAYALSVSPRHFAQVTAADQPAVFLAVMRQLLEG